MGRFVYMLALTTIAPTHFFIKLSENLVTHRKISSCDTEHLWRKHPYGKSWGRNLRETWRFAIE